MIVSTCTVLGLRCSQCGKIQLYSLSRFRLGKNGNVNFFCECGNFLIKIERKGRDKYCLQIECLLCETKHFFKVSGKELWNNTAFPLHCQDGDVEIAYTGQREEVLKSLKQGEPSLGQIAAEVCQGDYFYNPEIMYQVLNALRRMADEELMSCSCGEKYLELELFPDRVQLNCPYCNAVGIVFAESIKDLQVIENMEGIELEAASWRYLDDKRLKKKNRVKNK